MKTVTAELFATYGPCGREATIAELICQKVKPYVDKVTTDLLGNVIAVKNGSSGKNIMISCPLDRPGLVVLAVGNKYLRSDFVGNLSFENVHLQTAMFADGAEFTVYNQGEDGKKLFETSVGIDIENAPNKEEYLKTAQFVMLKSEYKETEDSVQGFGVGVPVCCEILLDLLQNLETTHTVTFVFTAMSQLDDKAIGCALYAVKPDVWIELKPMQQSPGKIEAGKGPLVEIPMLRSRGNTPLLAADTSDRIQIMMMHHKSKNPLAGHKKDHFGYAGYCALRLPVINQGTGGEQCLRSDIADTKVYISKLIDRIGD